VIPDFMTAIEIVRPGPPDVLVPATRPTPHPAAGEVLINVVAAGVNRPDVMQREGKYPPPPGAPDIPGLEVAGAIAALGSGVQEWKLGDMVCALVAGGGYAEYCLAPVPQCLPVPRGVDLISAAGMPETFFTVWTNVFERGRLATGDTLLVHGGSSGIGTTAIQMAVAFGAKVVVTAGSPEKCAACERLGAARAINYRTEDFVQVVKDFTAGRGVDVVLDMVGGEYVSRNIEALAIEGRLVQIAVLGGSRAEIDLARLMQRRITFTGSTLRPRAVAEKGAIASSLKKAVWPLVEQGRIRPVIHATYPLVRAADAHRTMEAGAHIGKLILTTA
jgi:putative PIG3 family NAD(P)H quinone oxidoreductase